MGYCIAFGADGAMDVTGRYCRNPTKYGLPRNRCPEAVLHHILDEIRRLRRRDRPKADKFKLEGEDMHETHELRHYYISGFVDELASLVPGSRNSRRHDADAQKAAESRQNGKSSRVTDFSRSLLIRVLSSHRTSTCSQPRFYHRTSEQSASAMSRSACRAKT